MIMNESRNQVTNGSEHPSAPRRSMDGRQEALMDTGRQIQADARNLATHVQEAGSDLERFIGEQVRQRPYAALAASAGIGYVLGGGLSSKLTVLLLGMATRFGMAVAAREIGNWAGQDRPSENPPRNPY